MEDFKNFELENAQSMNEHERLEAMFMKITNIAIQQLENELTVAQTMKDDEGKKRLSIQISMYRHAQGIFKFSKQFAADKRWKK